MYQISAVLTSASAIRHPSYSSRRTVASCGKHAWYYAIPVGISTLVCPRPTEYRPHIDDLILAQSTSVGITCSMTSTTESDVSLKSDAWKVMHKVNRRKPLSDTGYISKYQNYLPNLKKRISLGVLPHLTTILPPFPFGKFSHPCLVSGVLLLTNSSSVWINPLAMRCWSHDNQPLVATSRHMHTGSFEMLSF